MVERVLFGPGGSTEAKQDDVLLALNTLLTELQQKLEPGQEVALDAATLAALETVTTVVSGEVALDSATLAALESITAVVSGEVSLDPVTLAALEAVTATVSNFPANYPDAAAITALGQILTALGGTLNVAGPLTNTQLRATPVPISGNVTATLASGGTVNLSTSSLAALETINASVFGTVGLDGPTLAALETINSVVTNWPANFPDTNSHTLLGQVVTALAGNLVIRNLTLTQDSVRQTLRVSQTLSQQISGPVTDQVLVAIAPGSRLRLIRNAGHCDPELADENYPVVTLKIGSTTIYRDKLEPGLPWSETVCFEGADGEDLTVSVTSNPDAATIYLNCRYEVF